MKFILPLTDFLSDHLWILGGALIVLVAWANVSSRLMKQRYARKVLRKAVKSGANEPVSLHPYIDPAKCAGCGACVKACPEGDILQMIHHKAVLVKPTQCVGHGECERSCPFDAITLVFGTKTRGVDIPRLSSHYETNVSGLYIAGELGGMGLIRNAVKQGHLAVQHAVRHLLSGVKCDTDILIVGAGPAGLASCLTAVAEGQRYICIEQNSFGGTVYNFPRQKVVMTKPVELPMMGTMKFPQNRVTKEQLLSFWRRVVRKAKIQIRHHVKFNSLEKKQDIFQVQTSEGLITAQKVILCLGLRGTPRRLGLANEDSAKVAYNLDDPAQYQGQHVAVVGGGNAGVEAACLLAQHGKGSQVTLIVRTPSLDRCHEENQKQLKKWQQRGLVDVWYNSTVKAIEKNHLMVQKGDQNHRLINDFLFIYIGVEMPFNFLMSLGVDIDKRFGENPAHKKRSRH